MTSREAHLVELVDDSGVPVGSATVEQAHLSPGQLHRAFSVFLLDDQDRVLLQQRAAVKTRFPLRWGNTCCGHPTPGTPVTSSALERLGEEIGVGGVSLVDAGVYTYFAEDPVTGRVEREYDHVLVGRLPVGTQFRPDPAEVARLLWVSVPDLRERLESDPGSYAPWLSGVTARLEEYLSSLAPASSPASVSERLGGK
ncbi:isopentenyl-diphosphate delta-isomerase [Actinoplanes lutulentus]|uniref:Isopentenyl-diphosphate Delta-isomerase n=1 Tax=Actinoplanes lutulentus TaxID=1287878 RepID=A0A327ZA57_9ACTN|nr:isopentenyl-diphosphate Delta-isomerase [Actinoplanes lutulentus]MBB2944954.1 isopentenyl-diphosphate delta-isomerase [Actinoplanes lutulentus]RAK35258.1 isopentenyl-diphosphate delta-isomerase [Actinoplanes lutulentus]